MKVIVTGATGRVGGAAVKHCLTDPAITSVVVLARRPLDFTDPKITTIIKKDFLKYEDSELQQLEGAQGCVWSLASPTSGKEVHLGYTHAAIDAFQRHLLPRMKPTDPPFRLVYVSGGLVPYLASNYLFFLGGWRKLRLELDNEILAIDEKFPGKWESYVARPWHVLDEPPTSSFRLINQFILKPELGAAMVNAALHGQEEKVMNNEEMRIKGQEIIASLK